jgi:cytoskeleton protein RodZ
MGVLVQARKPAALVVRLPNGSPFFTRWLSAGDTYRAPRTPGLILDVVEPSQFDVYYNGKLTGHLVSNQTAVGKLIPAAPPPVAVAPNAVGATVAKPAVPAPAR